MLFRSIYLFNTAALKELLLDGFAEGDVDFGKNVIPKALRQKRRIAVYEYHDYWADVGTVESLWQANMDLLDDPEFLTLNVSKILPIYSKSLNLPPHVVLGRAHISKAIIADGSIINGTIIRSTIGYQTIVEAGAVIENAVILPNVRIGRDARLKNVIVNRNVIIPDGYVQEGEKLMLIDSETLLKRGEANG